jgi:predicted kinase
MQSDTPFEVRLRPRLVVLVGLPGSGKSSWAKRQNVAIISSDNVRFLLGDDENDQTIHADVFATARYILRRRLQLRRPLTILDATNLSRRERRPYIKTAQLYDCQVEAMFFDTPVEICKARNRGRERVVPDDIIDVMAGRLRTPTIDEGFDVVTVYRSGTPPLVAPEPLRERPADAGDQHEHGGDMRQRADGDAAIR